MDITKGNLDEISRPASNHRNHHRPGSRVSLKTPSSAGSTRQGVDTNNSLEILPPESPTLDQQVFDLEVVELFSSDSNSECDVNSHSDDNEEDSSSPPHHNTNTHNNNGSEDGQKSDKEGPGKSAAAPDPLDEIQDPKLREAMRKMLQLDRILAKKVIKEKEVKRQRLRAHRELERELQCVKPEGRDEQREVSENTIRFLALVPPPSHSEGVLIDQEPADPLFQTQPVEIDTARTADTVNKSHGTKGNSSSQQGSNTNRSSQAQTESDKKTKHGRKGRSKGKGHGMKPQGESDFIQRNIDLATDAGNVIAMTDDEKKRLEELLQDVEMLVDENDKSDSAISMNALQISAGVGYIPDVTEQQTLRDIDAKLKALLPAEDFERISTTPSQERSYFFHDGDLGEKILRDAKEERTRQDRLKRIEDELEYLEDRVEREIYESPRLSQENLSELLEQCSELSSRAATETDSILQVSPRSGRTLSTVNEEGYGTQEETPRLPDDVLQRLLAEARESCLSESRLSTVTPMSSLDTQQMTPRSDDSYPQFTVVSQSSIKELLRNPRATSNAVSATGLIMAIAGQEDDYITGTSVDAEYNGFTNGYSDSPQSADVLRPSSRHDAMRGDQTVSEQIWDAPSSPRHSVQSPKPPVSKRHSEKHATLGVGQAQSSLSLKSFTNSTDFYAASSEPPPSRARYISTGNAVSTPDMPSMSVGSPELSTSARNTSLNYRSSLLEDSESFEPSPPPPSSRKTSHSSRSKKAKQRSRSTLDSGAPSAAGRTDSQASTNTLVSSSDFEYEEDEEVSKQLLTQSTGAEVKDQRLSEGGVGAGLTTASTSIEQSIVRSIARFEKKGVEKERFSPPLV